MAVWSLSTAKPGNGVEQLRDDNIDTYWQSDGPQPHLINIQFHKKMRIHEIVIYTDFKLDESYTPSKISIRVGSTFHDLQEIHVEELSEPSGWVTILPPRPEGENGAENVLRTHFIQVAILANHQNGRDTHIRQIKICARRRALLPNDPPTASSRPCVCAALMRACPLCALRRHAAPASGPAHVPPGVLLHCLSAVCIHQVTRPCEGSDRGALARPGWLGWAVAAATGASARASVFGDARPRGTRRENVPKEISRRL